MWQWVIASLASVLLLAGCVGGLWVILPDEIGGNGLLVAEIRSDMSSIRATSPTIGIAKVSHVQPIVDGARYDYAIRDGILILPLTPGEHEIDALSIVGTGSSIPTAVGTIVPISTKTYPVRRKFTIQRGRATYLGQAFFTADNSREKTFRIVWIDNSREIVDYIRQLYPKLFASLASPDLVIAPENYRSQSQLTELRQRVITRKLSSSMDAAHLFDGEVALIHDITVTETTVRGWEGIVRRQPRYAAGPVGALAYLQPDATAAMRYHLLNTETSADLSECAFDPDRGVCRLSDSAYLTVQGSTVAHMILPGGVHANTMRPLGNDGLIVVDQSGDIHISDGRIKWQRYPGLSLSGGPYPRGSYGDFVFRKGLSGIYVFHRPRWGGTKGLILCMESGCKTVELPVDIGPIHGLFEGKAGLLIGPARTGAFTKDAMYIKSNHNAAWEKRQLAKEYCSELTASDDTGKVLQVSCQSGDLRSIDGGRTWQ